MEDDPKARILKAALKEFADNGKSGARMQAIADRASINKAMLNYYFTSKDQLYYEVIKNTMHYYGDKLSRALDGLSDAKTYIQTYVNLHLKTILHNPDLTNLVLRNAFEDDEKLDEIYDSMLEQTGVDSSLKKFVDEGQIKLEKPEMITPILHGLIFSPILFRSIIERNITEHSFAVFIDEYLDSIWELLSNGLFANKEN